MDADKAGEVAVETAIAVAPKRKKFNIIPDKEEIKAAIDEIRKKAGAEVAEKIEDNLISITTKINSMSTNSKELESEVKELRSEAYNKRHALKDFEREAKEKFQDYETQIEQLKTDNNNEELKSEVERLRG